MNPTCLLRSTSPLRTGERPDGSKRLGEVALVGIDSPVYKSGHIFQEILYMMISSEEVNVIAETFEGEKKSIISNGEWVRF